MYYLTLPSCAPLSKLPSCAPANILYQKLLPLQLCLFSCSQMIISASCGIEPNRIVEYKPNVDEAIRLSGLEVKSLVLQREESPAPLNPNDLVWQVGESVYNHHTDNHAYSLPLFSNIYRLP